MVPPVSPWFPPGSPGSPWFPLVPRGSAWFPVYAYVYALSFVSVSSFSTHLGFTFGIASRLCARVCLRLRYVYDYMYVLSVVVLHPLPAIEDSDVE